MMLRRAKRRRFAVRAASLAECLPRRPGTRLHCACVTRSPRLSRARGDLLILIGPRTPLQQRPTALLLLVLPSPLSPSTPPPLSLSLSLSRVSVAFYFTRR